MKITIAVCCLNEEKNINDCLLSLIKQDFAKKDYEILVVDNNSTDKTLKKIKALQKKYKGRIRLIINKKKGIAKSRNIALYQAKHSMLAFIDADCQAPKYWLKKLSLGFKKISKKDKNLVAVGGGNIPPKLSSYYQALGIMLNTFLGSRGSVQARVYKKDKHVEHLPCLNVLYKKKEIIKAGGFDEELGSIIEDEDLSYRLLKKGYNFFYLKDCLVIHKMRDNLTDWAKNMFLYGRGRVRFLKKHKERMHVFFLIPLLLVLTLPLSGFFYFPFMFFYSLFFVLKEKKLSLLLKAYLFFITTHIFYGLGEIYEVFNNFLTYEI
jgi:glycosyltransferase involved in cell wall biosynthesis